MIENKLFLIFLLGVTVWWATKSTYSLFTKHAFHKVKYIRMIPTKEPVPLLEVTFEADGKEYVLAKSAEAMCDVEQLLVWSAYNYGGSLPMLIHISITPWQRMHKKLDFTLEPALISDGIQHG